ncbi:MAG: DUF998 domain-containing protein [Bauldia sp.]|nr:DUF998 domain-containing protein [Bauldia sp.]
MRARWLLLAGAAAPILYTLVVIAGGLAWPGYSHVGNTISDLMALNAPNQAIIAVGLAVACLLGAALGLAIIGRLGRHDGRFVTAGAAVTLIGVLGAAISFFPVDGLPGPRSTGETIHLALTGIVFIAIAVAVGMFAFAARREAGFGRARRTPHRLGARRRAAFEALASFSFTMFGVVVASGIATVCAEAYRFEAVGLVERLIVGAYLIWLLVVTTALLRRTDGR